VQPFCQRVRNTGWFDRHRKLTGAADGERIVSSQDGQLVFVYFGPFTDSVRGHLLASTTARPPLLSRATVASNDPPAEINSGGEELCRL